MNYSITPYIVVADDVIKDVCIRKIDAIHEERTKRLDDEILKLMTRRFFPCKTRRQAVKKLKKTVAMYSPHRQSVYNSIINYDSNTEDKMMQLLSFTHMAHQVYLSKDDFLLIKDYM